MKKRVFGWIIVMLCVLLTAATLIMMVHMMEELGGAGFPYGADTVDAVTRGCWG